MEQLGMFPFSRSGHSLNFIILIRYSRHQGADTSQKEVTVPSNQVLADGMWASVTWATFGLCLWMEDVPSPSFSSLWLEWRHSGELFLTVWVRAIAEEYQNKKIERASTLQSETATLAQKFMLETQFSFKSHRLFASVKGNQPVS